MLELLDIHVCAAFGIPPDEGSDKKMLVLCEEGSHSLCLDILPLFISSVLTKSVSESKSNISCGASFFLL